jgi:hypothetical protein
MEQQVALRMIAEKAYDVGYSAKLHFSTHDIVEQAPGWIGMISLILVSFRSRLTFWAPSNFRNSY